MAQEARVIIQSTKSAHFYSTRRRKKGDNVQKVEVMKFDPTEGVKKHVMYKEVKRLSKAKKAKPQKAKAKAKKK